MRKQRQRERPDNATVIVTAGTEILEREFAEQTFERMLCQPKDATRFCRMVRDRTTLTASDFEILWGMLNGRKRGEFNHGLKMAKES